MRVVSTIPALALLVGATVGLFAVDLPWIGFASSAVLTAATGSAIWTWWMSRPRFFAAAAALAFFSGATLLAESAWRAAWHPSLRALFEDLAREQRAERPLSGRTAAEDATAFATVTGVLIADGSPTPAGASLSLDTRTVEAHGERKVSGGLLLTVVGGMAGERLLEWRAGRLVRAPVQLRRPARYLDPGVPDEEAALALRGTTLVGTVKSAALVEILAPGGRMDEAASACRLFARQAIASAVGTWSPRASAIVSAIVIGDRAGVDSDMRRRLQEAGTYHVIAISGGNIAILAGLTLGMFRAVGLLGRAAMFTAIIGLTAYGYVVGGGASVDRATLMAVFYFAGRAIDLRGPPLNALAVVASLLIAAEPLALTDPAFLLTFGATAAILVVAPEVDLRRFPRFLSPLIGILAASLAVEAALLPIAAMVFSRITLCGLVLNFAAIPLMAVAQIAGMALVPVSVLSARVATGIGWIAYVGTEGLLRSADLVRFAPALTWRVAAPGWVPVVCYYVGMAVSWVFWRQPSKGERAASVPGVRLLGSARNSSRPFGRPIGCTACCLSALSALWILAEPWHIVAAAGDGHLHVTFLDVGQGDSVFVRFPRGATLVVDAGGVSPASTFDIGDRVVAPVLRQAGVKRLGILTLTHGDADHIGGAPSLLFEFRPRNVWEGIPVPPFEPLRALRSTAQTIGARWTNVRAADVAVLDDVAVVVRHPTTADWERQRVRNDDSIVLDLIWRRVSVVLTGDIGWEPEHQIAPQFLPSPLRILKVPHHGSPGSSSEVFVHALAPRIAVVSVGRSNVFGHPAPAVLDRYRAVGADIFRTDRDGAVTIDTDGYSLDVQTFTGRHLSLSR